MKVVNLWSRVGAFAFLVVLVDGGLETTTSTNKKEANDARSALFDPLVWFTAKSPTVADHSSKKNGSKRISRLLQDKVDSLEKSDLHLTQQGRMMKKKRTRVGSGTRRGMMAKSSKNGGSGSKSSKGSKGSKSSDGTSSPSPTASSAPTECTPLGPPQTSKSSKSSGKGKGMMRNRSHMRKRGNKSGKSKSTRSKGKGSKSSKSSSSETPVRIPRRNVTDE